MNPPMPPHMPPPPRPKKSHGCLYAFLGGVGVIVVLIVVMVAVVAGSSGGVGGGGQEAAAQPDGATSGKKAVGIGDHVKDGKFTFTITKMRKGLSTYGDDEITQEHAQGQFVILTVTVTNHGDEAQLFDATDQHLFDGKNRKYNAESGMFTENDVFLNEINPGNTVKGKIAFDMPRHRAPTRIELHDSPFSDGVTVNLRDA